MRWEFHAFQNPRIGDSSADAVYCFGVSSQPCLLVDLIYDIINANDFES